MWWHVIGIAAGMLHVAALAAALMAFPPSTSVRDCPHVRTTSALLSALIADARAHSPTFVKLANAIESSDVIVYFEAVPQMEPRFRGRVHFMGAASGFRYLRIQVRTSMNRYDIIASVAHEMQHANEIASHPEVVSEDRLATLYRQIGDEHDWCMFETPEAQQAGRVVRAEILAP